MAQYLSEDEVFGQPAGTIKADLTGGYLSDAEVFGNSEPTDSEQQVVTSARAWRGAGAGRGSFNDPRRLDTEQGRRALEVERELDSYEALNPGESRESMRGAAEASVAARQKGGSPQSRKQQYMAKGYGDEDAGKNAEFDAKLEAELQARMDAKPVAESVTGERIATPYNPINEENRVKDLIRRDLAVRDRALGDFVVDAYSAIGQGLVNIPKMAVDVVAPDSPLAASLQAELKNVSARESDIIKARNELMQMSVAQREDAIGKYGETIRQLVTNPSLGVQEFARQVPLIAAMAMSAGAGGVLGRGAVSVAGRASAPVALADAISGGAIAARGASVGSTAAGIGAAGIMAGGDAAGSTYDRLMDRAQTPDSALAQNPDYQALLSAGKTPDDARREIAATKARMAAIAAAPLGLLGFAGAESAIAKRIIGQGERMTAGRAAGMVAKDNLGEQLEEGGTQLASNAAVASVDPRQSLMQGVPEAMATAAVTSAPFAAATGVAEVMAPAAGASVPYRDAPGIVRGADAQPAMDEAINAAVASTMMEREKAMASIGAAGSVEEAVAAANAAVQLTGRAVQLDNDRLLNQALAQAGIGDAAQGGPIVAQADAPPADATSQPAVADAGGSAPVEPAANYAPQGAAMPGSVVWTGRRGDGYATTEDATRALTERQRLRPNYEWSVRQNPEGRYVLEGLPKPQNGAAEGVSRVANTQGATSVQNAPERVGLAGQLAEAGFAQPRETIRDLRDQADQVQRLQAAIARAGDDASGLQLYTGPDAGGGNRLRSPNLGGRPVSAGVGDAAAAVRDVGLAAKVAFGWRPIPVTGLKNAYGVQFGGQVFVDVEQLAGAGQKLGKPEHVAIQTIGHETTHSLEKSADPQDRADYALLRQAVLANAKDGVVAGRVTREAAELARLPGETDAQFSARAQRYGENEVVADVSGNFWLDPKFWSRLYDLDASAMRRIAYKFMENAAKLVKAVKGSRLDNERFIRNIEQVREVAAQVWASRAQRGDSLFAPIKNAAAPAAVGQQDQAISKSAADELRPGVSAEVAPDPRNAEAAERWGRLTEVDKLGITKEVMDRLAAQVLGRMGLNGWSVEYTSGMFEGGINPSAIIRAPAGTDTELLGEVMRVFGYLLDQKGMVAFDESNTTSDSQAGFVKVVLPEGLSAERIDAIRKEIAARVPQAEGDTVRDGAIVYGNFSAYNDNVETLTDEQFGDAIADAVADMPESLMVSEPVRFHSEYEQAYWDDEYNPKGRDAYLEKTRYASNPLQDEAGRNDVRRWGRDSYARPWLESLARDTDARISRLVGDRQPRRDYAAQPDARADRARDEPPAQPLGLRDGQGRPDAQPGGLRGVDDSRGGGEGRPPRYGTPQEGSVSLVGYHYSHQPRASLNGAFYGSGLKGAEADRLAGADAADIRPRIFFYVDRGNGVMPEAGVGPYPHAAQLDNLYDVTSDPLGIVKATRGMPGNRANNWERAIMEAGFDGYARREANDPQHFIVLVGRKHSAVPVASANPRRIDGKANTIPLPLDKPSNATRRMGDELVRRPQGADSMEIIAAERAGIKTVAPSFKVQWGEARVLESEATLADAVFEQIGAKFRFGQPDDTVSRSRTDLEDVEGIDQIDDLGAFNVDATLSEMTDEEMAKFGIEPLSDADKEAIRAELIAELREEYMGEPRDAVQPDVEAPSAEEIKAAGLHPESVFETGRIVSTERYGQRYELPGYAKSLVRRVEFYGDRDSGKPGIGARFAGGKDFFVSAGELGVDGLQRLMGRQMAGAYLHNAGFDLASTYRKGTVMKIAQQWRSIIKAPGAFKLGQTPQRDGGIRSIAQKMGAFEGYALTEKSIYPGVTSLEFARSSDGRTFKAEVNEVDGVISCCTMGLAGSGGLGTEFYAVMGAYARNIGARFVADDTLSAINTYRRTEQAMSFALRTGDTGVMLPGLQNRVYGYNMRPKTREDHDKNLARLALAGLRNVEELFPEVRRLRYDPATGAFTDSRGRDAEPMVKAALADPEARVLGLGRSTIARAVITHQIVMGEPVKAESFDTPIAYSLADVGMDEPVSEAWGDSRDGVNSLVPGLRRFISGSKIVREDGTPVVMYHGTARDIHAFRAKQAGAIFLSYSPRFAGDFAALSAQWMQDHWDQVLTPEQQDAAKKAAAAAVMADKSIKMSERKAMKQSILDGKPEGMAADAMNEAARDMMPSGENVLPVFVRATAPFDFRIPGHVADLIYTLQERQGVDPGGDVTIQLVKEGGQKMTVSEDDLATALRSGMWEFIEAPEVQAVIREDLGHDGFFVKESGQVNLAVYDPGQVKSVFNRGTYDLQDERLSYSRAGLDEYMVRRNKTMPTISGATAQEEDIALAVKAIDAARAEIERGSKAILPIPLGRTPHVLGMFRAPNKMLRIDTSILRKVLFDKHSEDFADVSAERFVRAIYQPAMVLRGRAAGEFEIVTDIITKKGPIMVPVMTGGDSPSAAVMSAYAKNVNGAGESLLKRINGGALLYADPVLAQIAVTGREPERIRGIITSGAQFPSAPPQRAQADTVNQPDLYVKPLNPYYAGWDRAREAILGGIRERKVKSDVDLMRRIGDLYRGDWEDAPAFSRANAEDLPNYSKAAGYDLPVESFWYKARRKMQDYFIRARLVQEAIASQGGVVDEKTDFYRAEELSHGRISALLQDFADQQVQPLMEKAVKYGIELDELSLYAYAMHAKERNAYIASIDKKMPDGGSGMTNADADAVIQQVKASPQAQQMEELHADLMTITRANRLAMLADGLITQDEFNALEGAYEFYVPLRGFEVRDEDGKPTGRSAGKGINIRGPETLKAKGRKTRAGQIIENIISDHQRTIVRGERNHVGKVFLNFVLQNPDDSLWEIDATTTRKAFDRQTGRIARNTVIEKGEDTIAVKIQGREIYIKIKDDLLLRALRKTYTDETGELTNDLMRSVGLYSTLLRNTLTRYNPEFAVVNAMRDFGFGATAMLDELGEKGAAKFAAHYAGAMAASARNESKKLGSGEWDKWFLEYKATGGMTSGFYAKGLDEISSDIRDMMIEAGAAPKDWSEKVRFNKATRAAKAALRVLEYAGSVSENAARVAAYRTAREMGKSPSEAASIAKNLTTNFDRKGEYGQLLNALYLFYNAAIQGTQRTLKMFRNPKVMGYMSGVTAASVTLALMSASAGGDDPDDGMAYWDKIPAYVKERNIIIMLPPGEQMEGAERVGTKGRYLTIPVQYGLNIFHVFGYQIADVIRHQRDATRGASPAKAGVNLASAVAGSFNPFGGAVDLTNASSTVQAILPTVFDFPYQLATGTNAFGRDVAPYKSPFDSKPDSQNSNVRQAGTPAEHVAQWLNSVTGGSEYEPGAVDISAGTVENVVRNLTGGTGMFIYDALALTGKTVENYTGGDPDLFVRDIPILRRVYGESGGDVDQGLFYERRKAIQEAASIVRGAEEADVEIKDKEKLALASLNKPAGKYTRELTKLRKQMKEVQRDESLSDLERKATMRELRAERDRLTAEFNRDFMAVMREELAPSAAE